jgi:hypothetical protein
MLVAIVTVTPLVLVPPPVVIAIVVSLTIAFVIAAIVIGCCDYAARGERQQGQQQARECKSR